MILFDTNAVNLLPPDSARADIIRKLRESGHHRVAVPWMVLEEMAAHQAKHYPDRYASVESVVEKLQEVLPWELDSYLEPIDLERLLNHWRSAYKEIFEVIDTSGDSALKALAREAMALPPAKRSKDRSEGARDVAIWFSILEFLRENPEEHIYFVTDNTSDFGDGLTYKYPMNDDLRGLEDRLTRLANFDEVISRFTKEVSGGDAKIAAESLLSSAPIQSQLAQAAVEILGSPAGFLGIDDNGTEVQWSKWVTSPEMELLGVTDAVGHEIESDVWYTAKARLLLYGVAADGDDTLSVACAWEAKLLFSASGEDQPPTLLTPEDPSPPDLTDERHKEAFATLKKRAAATNKQALTKLSQQITDTMPKYGIIDLMGSANPAQQMAASLPKLDIAGILPSMKLVQQMADAMSKYDVAGLMGSANLAQQMAVSLPKLDIAGISPSLNLIQQMADTMPKYDVSGFANLARATESSAGEGAESEGDEGGEED